MNEAIAKPMIEWLPAYAVGVPQIDAEHQRLFALAEGMHQAMLAGQGKAALAALLADLVAYTCYHFEHEEQLMERTGYPGYQDHRKQHERFRSQVRAMQERAASGEVTMTIEVMQALIEWLKRHIAASDRLISDHMKRD
ncbi:MAG TPA: bacteriohemerythrin [Bryobacteraceae bacterium]|nr:bacteriohemerythrin [Bryobacteraceae bacterium]